MSRRHTAWLLGVGILLFVALLFSTGLTTLAANARATGWTIVPILLVFAAVYLLNTLALRLILAGNPELPSFPRLFSITVSSFAVNYLTPVVSLGGEPFKASALASFTGTRRATAAVVLFRMIHTLSQLVLWLTAVAVGLALSRDLWVVLLLVTAAAVLFGLIGFFLALHRQGGLERTLDLLHRLPLLHRLGRRLELHRGDLVEMDRIITAFYLESPGRFLLALGAEYAARVLSVLEYVLVCASVGHPISFLTAFLIATLTSVVQNVLFFLPYELGAKEGALFAIFQGLGLPSGLGVYTAVVGRVREVFWIAVGLALIGLTGARRTRGKPGEEQAPVRVTLSDFESAPVARR